MSPFLPISLLVIVDLSTYFLKMLEGSQAYFQFYILS